MRHLKLKTFVKKMSAAPALLASLQEAQNWNFELSHTTPRSWQSFVELQYVAKFKKHRGD